MLPYITFIVDNNSLIFLMTYGQPWDLP